MREDGTSYSYNDLHYHNGSTCHGSATLEACVKEAIKKGWIGQVLRKDDEYRDGTKVSCYTLISGDASDYKHWSKHGTFVAVVEITSRLL